MTSVDVLFSREHVFLHVSLGSTIIVHEIFIIEVKHNMFNIIKLWAAIICAAIILINII